MRLRITHKMNLNAREQRFAPTAEFCLSGAYAVADCLTTGQLLSLRNDRNELPKAQNLM